MTAECNGLQFTLLPKALPLIGFFNGSAALAGRPLPCRTSLLCPQSRVLSVPPLLLSSLTGPLDALCTSAFLVNSLSLMMVSPPHFSLLFHLSLLFHRHLLFHPTMILLLTGSRTVLCRGSHHSTVGGRGDSTPPGSGTQSWLFCPLISHGLALAESRMGVPPCFAGNREQVPSEQSQFWTAHALSIIRAYTDHFHSLDRCQLAAALLQSWQGGHLDSVAQEVVTPPNILSMIAVWLSDSVTQFRQGDSSHHASAPPPPPFPPPPDVPQPLSPR